jgi:hypothetical protein
MLSWSDYLFSTLSAALTYCQSLSLQLSITRGSLLRTSLEREAELKHLLLESIRPHLPFWPRGVRASAVVGQIKQASVAIPLSPWQWNVLVRDTPILTTAGVTERAILQHPRNPLQVALFGLRRERRGGGYCTVKGLQLIYNHRTESLRVIILGESYNKYDVRITARASGRRAFGAQRSIAASSVVLY